MIRKALAVLALVVGTFIALPILPAGACNVEPRPVECGPTTTTTTVANPTTTTTTVVGTPTQQTVIPEPTTTTTAAPVHKCVGADGMPYDYVGPYSGQVPGCYAITCYTPDGKPYGTSLETCPLPIVAPAPAPAPSGSSSTQTSGTLPVTGGGTDMLALLAITLLGGGLVIWYAARLKRAR